MSDAMKKCLSCLFFVFVTSLMGCGVSGIQIQAHVADSIAETANASLPILVSRYRQDGLDVLKGVKVAGGNQDDGRAAIDKVKARWEPVWQAWELLRIAQDAWATSLETGVGSDAALLKLKKAFCGLQEVWPKELALPLSPFSIAGCK